LLQNALGPMFESHTKALDLHGKISAANDAMKEMKSYMGGMTAKDDSLIEMKSQMEQMSITLKEAMEQLEELNGDLPRELSAPRSTSYKASEAPNNTISLPSDTQDAQSLDPLSWIDQFVVRQQQAGTPVPQTVAVVPNRVG